MRFVRSYEQFHDGWFDGLLITEECLDIFLSTDQKESFVLSVTGVVALASDELRAGNIIFGVEYRSADEITLDDIRDVYRFNRSPEDDAQILAAHAKAERERLLLLVIDPTYGGNCLVLAKSFELITRRQWIDALLGIDLPAPRPPN